LFAKQGWRFNRASLFVFDQIAAALIRHSL
jgi:hypothetical protein